MVIKPLFSKSYFLTSSKLNKVLIVIFSYLRRFAQLINLLIFKKYEIVLIEYELFPFVPAYVEYLLKKRGIKYIVDYDDAIFHKYDLHKNSVIRNILKYKIADVITYADQVIVCNKYLEDYAIKYNAKISRLPTVVLLENYMNKLANFQREEKDIFVIGWIGSRTTSVYILEILPVIKKIVENFPNVRFDLVGFDEKLLSENQIEEYHLNIIPWSEDKEIENILAFDVGIMPLHDDPWSQGKCGFKLIQYMSCKKPVIASAVGINKEIVQDNVNGFLVNTLEEWYNAIEKMYLDKTLSIRMANKNIEKIKHDFNYYKNCTQYLSLFNKY